MQHDNERSRGFPVRRDVAEHAQIAWVGAKPGLLARLRGIGGNEGADYEQRNTYANTRFLRFMLRACHDFPPRTAPSLTVPR